MISLTQGSIVKWNTNTNEITSVAASALTNNTFIMSFCDDTANKILFKVWNTNGTNTTGEVSVDDSAGACGYVSVDVCVLNSTHAIMIWYDSGDSDVSATLVNSTGSILIPQFDLDTDVGASMAVSCAALNSTYWVGCWDDNTDRDATCNVYVLNANTGADIDIDTEVVGGASSYPYAIAVGALNQTHWVMGYYDRNQSDASYAGYNLRTSFITAADEDTTVGNVGYSISITTHNSTHWSIGYYDSADKDATYSVYRLGTRQKGPIDLDAAVGASDAAVRVAAQNSTQLVITFLDNASYDLAYGINTTFAGATIKARANIEDYAATNRYARYQDIVAYKPATGIGLCNQNFVVVYANSSTQADWKSYYADGLAWNNGDCNFPRTPSYSLNSTNSTIAGSDISHNLYWQSDAGLSGYIFSFCNGTWNENWCNGNFLRQTTTQLQMADTQVLEDAEMSTLSPDCEMGINSYSAFLGVDSNIYYENMVKFDLGNYVQSAVVINATLCMYMFNLSAILPNTSEFYNVSAHLVYDNFTVHGGPWVEGTSISYITAVDTELNWDDRPGDGYYNPVPDDYKLFTFGTYNGNEWKCFNVTNSVKYAIQNNYKNLTIWFRLYNLSISGINKQLYFWSKEGSNTTLRQYLNVTYNQTYGWVNNTWTSMTGTGNWSNVTKGVNATVGANISWYVWANDTSGNSNQSSIFSYTTTSGASCDSSHCALCETQGTCETASCYWWTDETCHDTEESADCWTKTAKFLSVPLGCLAGPFTWEEII